MLAKRREHGSIHATMLETEDVLTERPTCRRCRKAMRTCYCARLKKVSARIEVVILQHPLEVRKAIGTARMTYLTIEGSRLIEGAEFASNAEVDALVSDSSRHCVVLFPGPASIDIGRSHAEWIPSGKRLVVFVIDGTWPCAKKMLRTSPNLAALPQIRFTPSRRSEYGAIRKQPAEYCFSTLEAVHTLLELLDPEAEREHLLDVFRGMVEQQSRFGPE